MKSTIQRFHKSKNRQKKVNDILYIFFLTSVIFMRILQYNYKGNKEYNQILSVFLLQYIPS